MCDFVNSLFYYMLSDGTFVMSYKGQETGNYISTIENEKTLVLEISLVVCLHIKKYQ